MYMSSPVISGKTLYGLGESQPRAVLRDGSGDGQDLVDHARTRGRKRVGHDRQRALSCCFSTTGGELIVARANPAKFEEVRRYTVADSAMWAHPALAPRRHCW